MTYDPAGFLQTAKAGLKTATTEADFRTVAGRSYYAAYGLMRARLCAAKKKTARELFGKTGRHTDVARAVSTIAPFRHLSAPYNGLLTGRILADYSYDVTIGRAEADSAARDAEWVVARLKILQDADFSALPI